MKDEQIDALIREIEEKQKRIMHDQNADAYTDYIGTIPRGDSITLEQIMGFWNTLDFIHDKRGTFSREDIPRIMDAIPHITACVGDYELDNGVTMSKLRFTVWIANQIGQIPVERIFYNENKDEDRQRAIESMNLTNDLITAFMGIEDETLKALVIYDLIGSLPFLEDIRDGVEIDEDAELKEAEEAGYTAIRDHEQKQRREHAQRLGVDVALIDKAEKLSEEAYEEIRDKIKDITGKEPPKSSN